MNKPASLHGIQNSVRGRPSKVVKPSSTPRRPARRGGINDAVDPDLEQSVQDLGQDDIEQQQHEFDAQAAAIAASAAQHSVAQHQQDQMDLTAAAVLAGANPLVNPHDHPELDQQHVDNDQPEPHTTESLAHQSGYESVIVESALAKRLAREPGMRLATQRRPEQVLNLGRRSNVEALFAHIAGDNAPVQCKNCHKGHGPWTTCVIVDGQMCGSCANCWFNASGARCSFHETRNPQAHGGSVLGADGSSFNMSQIPPAAIGQFNYVSAPASADPVVRYTIERAMADIRAADRKTRQILMIEAAAKQLAFQVVTYEETAQEEHDHSHDQNQPPPQPIMEEEHEP